MEYARDLRENKRGERRRETQDSSSSSDYGGEIRQRFNPKKGCETFIALCPFMYNLIMFVSTKFVSRKL